MAGMDRIVKVDAGEDCEHVGLEKRHQQVKGDKRDSHAERQNRPDPAQGTPCGAQRDDEARKDLNRNMAREDIAKQANAMRERAGQKRKNLNETDQRHEVDRYSARHEDPEKTESMFPKSSDDDRQKYQYGKRRGDDDMSRDCEGIRNNSDEVNGQDEHEQRKHEGKELHSLRPGIALHGIRNKFI